MNVCPSCGRGVVLTALLNERNGRWTVLPLDLADDPAVPADFVLTGGDHEAVDIMGAVVGSFPVAEHVPLATTATHRTHPPSHYLHPGGH